MYSFARSTTPKNSLFVKFEALSVVISVASNFGRSGSGPLSLVIAFSILSSAFSNASSPFNFSHGRTGVTIEILSSTLSNTAITVGRTNMPSGSPRVSSGVLGSVSIRRTMS